MAHYSLLLHQFPQLGPRVSGAHERFAHQKDMDSKAFQLFNLLSVFDPALANHRDPLRDQRHQALRRLQSHFECLQIAVVDADQMSAGLERALQLRLRMDLDQRLQRERPSLILKFLEQNGVEQGGDQQHRIRAETPSLRQLVAVHDKILAQKRKSNLLFDPFQVEKAPLEKAFFGNDRQGARSAGGKVLGDPYRIELLPNKSLRRRSSFDFGDNVARLTPETRLKPPARKMEERSVLKR